ncbi:MAG: MFS transporter [Candidatus Methanomethyliaceae archaeon]|nr:MFS transporter [Candidatus Methanomethyliaceae archaeon]MDW7970740.1 MFS transporter [Nitrososphaerota archaeon]
MVKIIFASIASLYFFALVHRVGIAVIALDMMKEFSMGAELIGIMSSMYFFPYAASQIPVGIMLDRIGVRKTAVILSSIACLGGLIFSIATSPSLLIIGRALIGFGMGGIYVSGIKAISIWFNPNRIATLVGLLTSFGNLGAIFASYPLALITLQIGWRGAFLLITIIMILFTLITWFEVKEVVDRKFYSERSIIYDIRRIFLCKHFLNLAIIPFFSYGLVLSFQGLWGGPFLMDVYNMDKTMAGMLLLFIAIGFILLGPISGSISDKIKRRKPNLIVGILISTIFWLIMYLFGNSLNIYSLVILFFSLGASYSFFNIYMIISKELFDSSISGMAIASLNLFNFIGAGFFQYVMGLMLENSRDFQAYQSTFLMAFICMLFTLIFATRVKETYKC